MSPDKDKIRNLLLSLFGIVILVWLIGTFANKDSKSLSDYAMENPELQNQHKSSNEVSSSMEANIEITNESFTETTNELAVDNSSELIGFSLNKASFSSRSIYKENFYSELLSEDLIEYITGISFPMLSSKANEAVMNTADKIEISTNDLRYLHILHYNFDGEVVEGELICNKYIEKDLLEIFYELYENEYQLEKVHLVDEYNGDDTASMIDNNTSCFNYRPVEGSKNLSKHAYGCAIDINPRYNPYVTYNNDGTTRISPENGIEYADRDKDFPYKIDKNDLCYQLFKEHGFTWGGSWNSLKDYQHFQKPLN